MQKHRSRRGFGLIEVILAIAVILSLLIGGMIMFNQGQLAMATSETGRLITSMTSEARSMFRSSPSFTSGDGLTEELLISAGLIPESSIDPVDDEITLPFGGVLYISAHPSEPTSNMLVTIVFPFTRDARSLCNRLSAPTQPGAPGVIGVGYRVENRCDEAAPTLYATFSKGGGVPPILAVP